MTLLQWAKNNFAELVGLLTGVWFVSMLLSYMALSFFITSAPIKASIWIGGAFTVITIPFAFAILSVCALLFRVIHVSRIGSFFKHLTWVLVPFFIGLLSWFLGRLLVGETSLVTALTISGGTAGLWLRANIEKTKTATDHTKPG